MAKIVTIGASGGIGAHILNEALSRGHKVTGVTHSSDLPPRAGLTPVRADLADSAAITEILRGHDAVISAYSPGLTRFSAGDAAVLIGAAHESLFAAFAAADVGRLILVGGVGSLQAEADQPGDVVDAPFYPAGHKAHTYRNREILAALRRGEYPIDWTYVSPPLDIFEGPRTGNFRLGTDILLRDADGESRISRADFAIAILDELDAALHCRARFTAAY